MHATTMQDFALGLESHPITRLWLLRSAPPFWLPECKVTFQNISHFWLQE